MLGIDKHMDKVRKELWRCAATKGYGGNWSLPADPSSGGTLCFVSFVATDNERAAVRLRQ